MKKTAIIISTLALFVFATAGCKDAYKANPDNNPNNEVYQTIKIDPVRPLEDITNKLNGSMKIDKLVIVEDGNRELDFQLVPASGDPEEIVSQYQRAYQKNTDLIKKLLPDDQNDPDIQSATDEERRAFDALNAAPKTLNTIIVSSVTLFGLQEEINNFKQRLEE